MFGDRLIKSNNAGAACTTDTVQILDGVPLESIATYQLNNATTSIPSNTYPGTPTDITYATGKFGQAAVFNGSSSYIDTTFTVPAISTYSASLWFKTSATGINQCIFSDSNSNGQDNSTRLGVIITNANTFGITLGNGSTSYYNGNVSAISYLNNAWHNLVITYSGTTIKLYINNSLIVTYTSTVSAGTLGTQTLKIGRLGDYSGFYFNGSIDQVRIFNTALSVGAVTSLYNETVATASNSYINVPSCVAYYKMSDATDETGSYDGTPTNVNFNVAGKFGNAASFNGLQTSSASYINIPSSTTSTTSSVSIWFNTTVKDSNQGNILDAGGGSSGNTGFAVVRKPTTGYLQINFTDGTTGQIQSFLGSTDITDGNWHNVVLSMAADNTFVFYLDGSSHLSGTRTRFTSGDTQNLSVNRFGTNAGSVGASSFNGKIDQVRIFNRAITSNEVETLYNEVQCIPTIVPTDHFEPVLYTGNNTATPISTGFAPDLVWIKNRTGAPDHHSLIDSVRGKNSQLFSNLSNAENTFTNQLDSFDSNGFTVGTGFIGTEAGRITNVSGVDYVAWNWKAGGTAVSNTDGTITSQVSANVDAGFSIVSFTNTSSESSVGHGLNEKPSIVILKATNASGNWNVYTDLIDGSMDFLRLQLIDAAANSGRTLFNSSVFYTAGDTNSYIGYCFAEVDGYSKFGSYVGTGASGNSIVTGFRPAFVMMKAYSTTSDWFIVDNKRNANNPRNSNLRPNNSNAEANAASGLNFLSNGFEFTGAAFNDNNVSWIYMAFAEENVQPEPELANSFNVVTYTGNGSTQAVTGLGFQPDLVWIKNRAAANPHSLQDSVRGDFYLRSNATDAEAPTNGFNVSSFNSDGFTVKDDTNGAYNVNGSVGGLYSGAAQYVAWAWKASNDSTINQDGSITSIVSANPAAGFSVVSTQSDGSGYLNFGHGLSQAPELVITKFTGQTGEWYTYTSAISNGFDVALKLNSSDAAITAYGTNKWSATSTVVAIGNPQWYFTANVPFITYCFHSVDGYQKVGSYTGNGTTSNRIYTTNDGTSNGTDGFEPRFLLVKQTNASRNWNIYDNLRVQDRPLFPNLSSAEAGDAERLQFNSDGFTWTNSAADFNASGGTYIYLAIA